MFSCLKNLLKLVLSLIHVQKSLNIYEIIKVNKHSYFSYRTCYAWGERFSSHKFSVFFLFFLHVHTFFVCKFLLFFWKTYSFILDMLFFLKSQFSYTFLSFFSGFACIVFPGEKYIHDSNTLNLSNRFCLLENFMNQKRFFNLHKFFGFSVFSLELE